MIVERTDNGRRFYLRDGVWLPSVTTVLARRFPGPSADDEEQRARWRALAERGTRVHELIAQGHIDQATWDSLPCDVQHALLAWQRFVYEWHFRRHGSEVVMASPELGYGGRVDAHGAVTGGVVLVDFKTGRLWPDYCELQLGGYWGLWLRHRRRRPIGALAVQLHPVTANFAVLSRSAREMDAHYQRFMEVLSEWKEENEICQSNI